MPIFRIMSYPHVILKKKASKVEKFTSDLKNFTDSMLATMHEFEGIGLAAPQVGISKQILVVDLSVYQNNDETKSLFKPSHLVINGEQKEIEFPLVVVNPRILKEENEILFSADGCLSFPGASGFTTKRFSKVEIEAENLEGTKQTLHCEGILSICLQHEIDHLNGILFIDRLADNKDISEVLADMEETKDSPAYRKKLKKLHPIEARDLKLDFL